MAHYVIIGDGAAGTTAAQAIRERDPSAEITIFSDDPHPAYYRAALTHYLVGELSENQIWATPPDFYQRFQIKRKWAKVGTIQPDQNRLFVEADNTPVTYDKLIIASGSRARRPEFAGADAHGVMVMRTLVDVRRVMDLVKLDGLKRAVIVGGGPLAMEWVVGLHERGVDVTYLLRGDHLMRRTLDKTASDLTLARMRLAGVDVRTETEVEEVVSDQNGAVRAVRLNKGGTIDTTFVGVAIGVVCNSEFLAGSGVIVEPRTGAVVVDRQMATSETNIYACGDIAQVDGELLQLWEPARVQGRIAGINATGGSEFYAGGAHYNATRLYDLDFASVGNLRDGTGVETAVDFPQGGAEISYRKLFLRNDRLVGVILLGERKLNVRKMGRLYKKMIDAGVDVGGLRGELLDQSFDLVGWMKSKNGVGSREYGVRSPAPQGVLHSQAALRGTVMLEKPDLGGAGSKEQGVRSREYGVGSKESGVGKREAGGGFLGGERLVGSVVFLGRDSEQATIVLDSGAVSHLHAQLTPHSGSWYIRDLGSSNGTFVNDERVTVPVLLKFGDVVRVGDVELVYSETEDRRQETGSLRSKTAQAETDSLRSLDRGQCVSCGKGISAVAQFCPHCGARQGEDSGVNGQWSVVFGQTRVVLGERVWLGRDSDCELMIPEPAVSGRHVEIVKRGSDYFARDNGSANGTMLDGKNLGSTFVQIKPNSILKLANRIEIRVEA